jgi:signal peptidase I
VVQLARALLVATLLALFVRTYLLQLYRVPSDSMLPGLLPGDHVMVDRFIYSAAASSVLLPTLLPAREPRRFDVVVIAGPGGYLIKRLLGLPGERVEVRRHQLWADGRPIDDGGAAWLLLPSPAWPASPEVPADFGPLKLGTDQYLVLGDKRGVSLDSRSFGPIERREIVGRAFLIYFSIPLQAPSFGKIEEPARSRWLAARWNRCFRPLR